MDDVLIYKKRDLGHHFFIAEKVVGMLKGRCENKIKKNRGCIAGSKESPVMMWLNDYGEIR